MFCDNVKVCLPGCHCVLQCCFDVNCELTSLTSIKACSRAGTRRNAVPVYFWAGMAFPYLFVLRRGTLALQRSRHFGVSDSPETMRQDEWRKRFFEYSEFSEGQKLPLHLEIPVLKSFQLRGQRPPDPWPGDLPLDSHYRGCPIQLLWERCTWLHPLLARIWGN